MKSWEEMTKLDKRNKMIIAFYILMIIIEIITAIISKEIEYLVIALMWGIIATIQYTNTKNIEIKNEEIETNKKIINKQAKIIISQNDMISNLMRGDKDGTIANDKE